MLKVREYLGAKGNGPCAKWFDRRNATAAANVVSALHRLEQGNFSNAKSIGSRVHEYRIGFGPGYRIYFAREGGRQMAVLAGLQAEKATRGVMMALTREFKETIQVRAQRDPEFRKALLQEGVECLLAGDLDTGKAVLRDYINATTGFEVLSEVFGKSSKSLMRMFGAKGNPQASNLFAVISYLQEREGVHLEVEARKVA